MTIVKRTDVGRPLTFTELDGNFDAINAAAVAAQNAAQNAASAATLAGTGGSALIGMPDGSTLASTFLSSMNRVVDSIAALRAINRAYSTRAFVTGYRKATDGGGGPYQYDPNDTSSLDDGFTVIVAADGGRWKLQINGPVTMKQAGAVGDGATDDTAAVRLFFNTVLTKGYAGYIDVGTYKCTSALSIDIAANSRLGCNIDGAGSQRAVFDLTPVNSGIPFQIIDSNGSTGGDGFYHVLRNFGIKTNVAGVGVALGQENFADALNSLIVDNIVINNASTNAAACALEINHVLASQINVVANCNGAGDAIRCRQMQFSKLTGAGGSATNGLHFTGGYCFGNNIDNIDLEVVAYCVVIDAATVTHNNFHGGQFVWTSGGISATAGANNMFFNPNFGVGSNQVTAGTGVTVFGAAYGSLTLGNVVCSPVSGDGAAVVDSVDGNSASMTFRRAGKSAWAVTRNNAAQSGSNAGSDLIITRYDDNGASIDNPLYITRSNGQTTIATLSARQIGFFGAGVTTSRPAVSGSRGGNAALVSLLTVLGALGLVTDSTSA